MWPFPKQIRQYLLRRLPLEQSCTLRQNRIYLLPTRFGLLMLVVAMAVWIGALNYAVSLAYALAFWIVGLMLLAVLMAYRQLAGLRLQAGENAAVFAGEAAACTIKLDNPLAQGRFLQMQWLDEAAVALSCRMDAVCEKEIELELRTRQRGRQTYPVLQVWSTAPFGLMRASAWVRLPGEVLVWPLPQPDRAHQERQSHQPGRLDQLGDEDDFSHLKEYRRGDPPRQIVWSVLARRDLLVSKHFASSGQDEGLRYLSWQDYPAGVEAESRLSRLCWRILQCDKRGQRYCLSLPGQEITPQPRQTVLALNALAQFRASP